MPNVAKLHAVPVRPMESMTWNDELQPQLLESARYAVLRRIGPALRHQIAGSLQPMSMMSSMVERRIQMEAPDLGGLRKNCAEMSGLARSASSECVALMGWLAPPEKDAVALGEAVDDCLHLLSTEFSFRGFTIVNEVGERELPVSRNAVRTVLTAVLMALSDAANEPGELHLTADVSERAATLIVAMKNEQGDTEPSKAKAYRELSWKEVELLAHAERVALKSTAQGAQMVFEVLETKPRDGADVRWG